ncbi:MAG: L-threonylcarbamoyladenylate synthase type 1 TsaC, partial [Candidatus Magasanikbacteria bacterium CG10_big_fil_rev_8_21_14_0_10_43_6]
GIYWPGPLTVVARLRSGMTLPQGVCALDRTIAFRISSYPLVESLLYGLQKPLVSTSANIASMESPYDVASVL